jgi:hypothetical protein
VSEYQYHEWQAVDRVLTPEEQAAVNGLSSHIEVGSSRAIVTYHWSDFRHDPKQVLLEYFDAYFYLANWGTLRLMFRFPIGLLDTAELAPYCFDEYFTLATIGDYQVLDLYLGPEDSIYPMEDSADLSLFVQLRADLLQGDYRLLYLAWLKVMTVYGDLYADIAYDDGPDVAGYDPKPPVPPGLKRLSPALQSFVQVFAVDPFLVQAAAEDSPDLKEPRPVAYRQLIERLPRGECDDLLVRLAERDPAVGPVLRKRLRAFLPQTPSPPAGRRTIEELIQRAEELERAEKRRQAEAARQKHIAAMKALAEREMEVWQQVEELLATGGTIASVYDQATGYLEKLEQLAEFQGTRDVFRGRLHQLAQQYARRPSLIGRWKRRNWI